MKLTIFQIFLKHNRNIKFEKIKSTKNFINYLKKTFFIIMSKKKFSKCLNLFFNMDIFDGFF